MKVILIFATSALFLCQAHAQIQRPSQEHFSGTAGNSLTNGQSVNNARNNGIFLSGATAATPSVGNSLPSPLNAAFGGAHYGFGPFSHLYSGAGSPYYGAAFNPLYIGAALAHTHYGGPLSSVPGLVNPVFPGTVPSAGLLPYSNGLGFPGATFGLNPFSLLPKPYGATYGLTPFSSPLGFNPYSTFALKNSALNAFPSTYGLHSSPFGLSSAYRGLGLYSPFAGLSPFSYGPKF